jgi:hypothetical protein
VTQRTDAEVFTRYQRRSRPVRWLIHYALACSWLHDWGERAWPWNVAVVWEDVRPVLPEAASDRTPSASG